MAQVTLGEAIIMSKAILFRKTAFPIRDVSVFSKDRLCQPLFRTCWVNLKRAPMCAIMAPRSVEGIKTAAKSSYQKKREYAHLVSRKGRLAALGT